MSRHTRFAPDGAPPILAGSSLVRMPPGGGFNAPEFTPVQWET
jgi:hypothetical protein